MTAFVPADIHISLNSDPDFDRDNPIVVGCTATSLLTSNPSKFATAFLPSLVSPPADSSKKTLIWDHHMPSMSTSTCDTLNTSVPAFHASTKSVGPSAFVPADILTSLNSDPDFDRDNPAVVISQGTSLLSYKHSKLAALVPSKTSSDPSYGFVLSDDVLLKRCYVSDVLRDSHASKLFSSRKATRNKIRGAYIIAINGDRVFSSADVLSK